jgi:hypothetical protein
MQKISSGEKMRGKFGRTFVLNVQLLVAKLLLFYNYIPVREAIGMHCCSQMVDMPTESRRDAHSQWTLLRKA